MKGLLKLVDICQSYHENQRVSFFMDHSVEIFVLELGLTDGVHCIMQLRVWKAKM